MKLPPRMKIAHLPTPIEEMPRLSAELAGPRLFIKRDDQTGLAFGGNKTRKIEFLLADAQSHGAQTLITGGAIQSNHCRQVAAAAARFGYSCLLVLAGDDPGDYSANLMLDRMFGADLIWAGKESRDQVLEATFQTALVEGRRPYLIPYGGSNTLGAAAYVAAIQELTEQINCGECALIENPDWIVFASSSGGTQAGMMLGGKVANFNSKILGISVDEPSNILQTRVANLANQTAKLLDIDCQFSDTDVLVNSAYTNEGYGVMGELERGAIALFAKTEGILLDPVYTGRAAGGLIDLIRSGFIGKEDSVLFWHTGGTPALFADNYRNMVI